VLPVIACILAGAVAIPAHGADRARVVAVTRADAVSGFHVNDAAVAPMLETGLCRLFGRRTAAEALATLVSPADTVAVHISTRGRPPLATHRALVDALVAALIKAGIPPRQIIIWGRNSDEMAASAYSPHLAPPGVRLLGIVPGSGFDQDHFYFNENVGELIWGDLEFVGSRPDIDELVRRAERDEPIDPKTSKAPRQSSSKSYFAKVVTRMANKIINVPVMANSESTGLYGCIASLALDSVDNNRRFEYEPMWGDPALAEIFAEPPIREKTVLHIMDGLLAQYAGGPSLNVNYCHEQATLYISRDPVAIDATAAALVEKLRATRRLPELAPILGHVQSAEKLGLGVADPARIRLETIDTTPGQPAAEPEGTRTP